MLSTVYLLFLTFVPISVGVMLVWSSDRAGALWWVSVLSINWVVGALSYFVLPSMGPAFTEPQLFAALPDTGTATLQHSLLEDRRTFVGDPVGSGELQSIAAFASLHISIVFAGALMAHLLRAARALRIGMWVYLGAHVPGDDLLRLALRGRRPRRLRDRLRVRLPRRGAHRLADRAQQGDRRAAAQERLTDGRA